MNNLKSDFKKYIAQTSNFSPFQIEVEKAEGIYVYDRFGKDYIDLMSGISVSNIGHRHPKVLAAIKEQLDRYMHVMVYGEFVESPQVKLAKKLAEILPATLNMTYFVNSGS
ncbi:MAG: aminotransferase class III-fold pyridoxal phosphate-dependent enzyme, partial [Bacteroidales bacterium]